MGNLAKYLADAGSIAFLLLGVATAAGWLKRRDRSTGWLALAIVAFSLVSVVGSVSALIGKPSAIATGATVLSLVVSAYALLRYRGSLIPLPRAWHAGAVAAMVVGTVAYAASQVVMVDAATARALGTASAVLLLLIWCAVVAEPTVRFWLAARTLPAVQAWRLRSLSLGFAAVVALLVFAIVAGSVISNPVVQILVQLLVIAVVPLLYVSFSPPAWLRREWRASEEEGLRRFMEELLMSEDRDGLGPRALDWAVRLVGGVAAVSFDSSGHLIASSNVTPEQIEQVKAQVSELQEHVGRITLSGASRTVLNLSIAGLSGAGRLVIFAGPFTPAFGSDEVNRVQQFMSAFVTALDRRHLIEQLKETNLQLSLADKHKTVFLASMSHELRTPLNAILGFSELLMDSNNGQFSPATRKRFLEQIHSSGKHLLGLINDILDLSKIEAGQMELRLQPVVIADVVSQVVSTVEPLAAPKNISVVASERDAGVISADPGKVKQMLLNLVANAVKFTPEGGTVSVRAHRLEKTVELSVTDNGIGIPLQDQERIFHEFQQVDSGIGRTQQGTGLGLTLTRRFAGLHGGEVRLKSELGQGSEFTISLPFEPPHVVSPIPPSVATSSAPHDSRPMVLVVEDDPPAAELLCRQVERAGFRTEVARTGGDALAKARAQVPAAITLDILLPDLDGWEVLTRLKRDEATSQIPVVIVSVVDNPQLGVALGALDYFVKPVPARELVERLAKFNFAHREGDHARVLVVDDEEANREWLRRVLEPAGFAVVLASGGTEAIDLARSDRPDLVLLDLMMPEVTGFDVVEALRADEATRTIPIMVLTAKSLTEADIRQLNGHVSTILRRGSTGASDLLDLLRQVVAPVGLKAVR